MNTASGVVRVGRARAHCWRIGVLALLLVVGCRGDDDSLSATAVVPIAVTSTSSVDAPPAASPTMQPGYVASPLPSPGRLAPDVTVESLRIAAIRVFADAVTGLFAVHANLTNIGTEFLNEVGLRWQILDAAGNVLDQDDIVIDALAPGETTSLVLTGTVKHDDAWASVNFELLGGR